MTIEELKEHCEKQIQQCEFWARTRDEEPGGKVYEEHKLILELIEYVSDMKKAKAEIVDLADADAYGDNQQAFSSGLRKAAQIIDKYNAY